MGRGQLVDDADHAVDGACETWWRGWRGLVAFVAVSTPLWQPGQRWPVVALIDVLAGAVMAATMAAVTGTALVRITRAAPVSPGGSPASR